MCIEAGRNILNTSRYGYLLRPAIHLLPFIEEILSVSKAPLSHSLHLEFMQSGLTELHENFSTISWGFDDKLSSLGRG